MTEMEGHDHDYYAVAAELNPKVWKFLMESKLEKMVNSDSWGA